MKINLNILFLVIISSFQLINTRVLTNISHKISKSWALHKSIEINNVPITALAFSPNEYFIVTGSLNTIHIHSVNGNLIQTIENAHAGDILDLKFCSTGQYLASSGTDKKIQIWDAYNNFSHKKTLHTNSKPCPTLDFLPGTNTLASGCPNGDVKIWNIFSGEVLFILHVDRPINSIALSPDKKNFTWGMNISSENTEKLNIFDIYNNNKPTLKLLYGREDCFINEVKYSQFTGHMACICSQSNSRLQTIFPDRSEILIFLIDFDNNPGYQIVKAITNQELINSFDFLSASTLVTGYDNGMIKIWNFETSSTNQSWQAHYGSVNKILFMPQLTFIISAGNDGLLKIWKQQ